MKKKHLSVITKNIILQFIVHLVVVALAFAAFFLMVKWIPRISFEGIVTILVCIMISMAIAQFFIGNDFYKKYYDVTYIEAVRERHRVKVEAKSENKQNSAQTKEIQELKEKLLRADNTIETLKETIEAETKNSRNRTRQQRCRSCERSIDSLKDVYDEIYGDSKRIVNHHSSLGTIKNFIYTVMELGALFCAGWLVYLWVTVPEKVSNDFIEKIFTPLAALFTAFFECIALKNSPNDYHDEHKKAVTKREKAHNNCAQLKAKLAAIPTKGISEVDFNHKMEEFSSATALLLSEIKNVD
ncbi:hypothetical protein Hs30E_10500 [Lactococcus hodotermopsidis]|uniref:Uncharacterized protein n=1 Tax=Pseudolactococcus hodotermopsidis TaxID=2709157 RepID=A0A6A0BAP8_9LACT|nr:hypothetical protein [Lactococcus hodotermopsidis]GFH42499.1 hypothetical protein Hs30E_10500 [Lactococcus hodotermopsidis]